MTAHRGSQALTELLARQCGLLSRGQALAHGLTDETIQAHLDAARWQRAHRGVFAAFTGAPTWQARCWAAVLYAGKGATLSHDTAAALADFARRGLPVHVTVPGDRRVKPPTGVRVHRCARLAAARHPLLEPPRTRPADTVLDLVDESTHVESATAVVARACQRGATSPAALAEALSARPRLRWRRQMREILGDVAVGAHSALETRYLRAVERAHALPHGLRQRRVGATRGHGTHYTDVAYEDFATLVELDGRLGHAGTDGRLRDLRRDNAAVLRGERTLRFGWNDVYGRPCAVAAQVAQLLTLGGWKGCPRRCGTGCSVAA